MSALDGKIAIGVDYRPCMVHIPAKVRRKRNTSTNPGEYIIESPEYETKALFHFWHPVTGNGIVEYEDGAIHEVEPTQIRFVDNAMSEYVFPEMEKNTDKVKNEWKPLKRVNHVCPKCGQGRMKLDEGIVLTSDPPQYRYQCDKCGYIECSFGQIEVSEIDEYELR